MATKEKIIDNIQTPNTDYIGSSISYIKDDNSFISGEKFDLKPIYINPVAYTIAHDVFSLVTENKYYDNVFDKIRDTKEGTGSSTFNLSAFAANDFTGIQNLSAVAEDESTNFIIGISDTEELNEISDITVFSLNTTVNFSEANNYWKYQSGVLSSEPSPNIFTDDHYFYFKFITSDYCNIVKTLSGGEYYLTYESGDFVFNPISAYSEQFSEFVYSYNPETSQIALFIKNGGLIGYTDSGELSSVSTSSLINEDNNVFNLDSKNFLNQEEPIRNSFLPIYLNKNTIGQSFEVDNMALYTHNYNSYLDNNSNYITLKSNLIYDEQYSLIDINQNSDFRQYSSINSGIRGDSGYNNFILGYNSNWYKYDFTPDKQTYFNVPFELYGYDQININDCKLIENGAIGGNSPLNADKLYKKQYEYADFKNTGATAGVDNAKYLCSWLYFNPLYPKQSIWLDRYYIPDKVTQLDALSVDGWNFIKDLQSFSEKHPYTGTYETYYNEFDRDSGVIDIESKLTIQPNSLYLYERIGSKTSEKIFDELSSYKLDSRSNETLDNTTHFYLLTDSTVNDEEFTLNVVLDNFDLETFNGNKIFGNRTVSLIVDKDFSPYNISVDGSNIHYYDYDYNYIKSLNLSSDVMDVIFTDDYNKFYVECADENLYTIESLDFITNSTSELSGIVVNDIVYNNTEKYDLFILDDSGQIYGFNPELGVLSSVDSTDVDDDLLLYQGVEPFSSKGDAIDYSDNGGYYTLSSNQILYKDIETPIISSPNTIVDFYVDKNDVIYVLKEDELLKINNQTLTELDKSVELSSTYSLTSLDIKRYQRDGEILEYIDVIDKGVGADCIIHRYDKDLNFVESISKTVNGVFLKNKSRFHTKFLDKELTFKVTLFDIFNYHKRGDVELTINKELIDESEKLILNIIFSNRFGTITTYFNGNLIDIFKFDENKFYFSNTLRDNKIFVGASPLDDESLITDVVFSANNDMISGSCEMGEFSIYDKSFNYFDVINYNRIYRDVPDSHLIIPVKTRGYIEEIAGFYNQNKNIRKSEYGSINIAGTDLKTDMEADVENRIEKLFEETFINLRTSDINIL